MKSKFAHSKFGSMLAFLDILFNMFMGAMFLFILSYVQIKPDDAPNHPTVEYRAEYIISMTWPDDSFDDVDLWVMLPSEKKVYFRAKDVDGYATLDRDDRGAATDAYNENGVPKILEYNKEIVTFRSKVAGHYVVNVHVWKTNDTFADFKSDRRLPYKVRVILTKLNPKLEEVITAEFIMEYQGQQKTAFTFDIDEQGNIINIDKSANVPFIDAEKAIRDATDHGIGSGNESPGDH